MNHYIEAIVRSYADGEISFELAIQMLGNTIHVERILKQWAVGKISFAESVKQLEELRDGTNCQLI